jgi:hypothetical protein
MYYPDKISKPIINILAKISLREISSIDIQNNIVSFHYNSSTDALQDYSNFSKKLEFINKDKKQVIINRLDMPSPDPLAINALNEYDKLK